MKKISTWWKTEGWPWLQENWWVLLLLPLMLLVAVGMFVWNRAAVSVIEPLKPADDRARLEAETRARELEAEKTRLEAELAAIQKSHANLLDQFEAQLDARVDTLRQDPEKLRQAMLAAGRR